ncbi:MAG: inorganic phosphate transporter [Brachybacterium sp.]|nr:inorganic phosphate transporter [Brachybacterium sp.]
MVDPLLVSAVLVAVVFAYVNGMQDASNAVSTTIATRSLTATSALRAAAMLNVLGGIIGVVLPALTVAAALALLAAPDPNVLGPDASRQIAVVVMVAGIAVILWNLVTWALGIPSSSWHALFGAMAGAAFVSDLAVAWGRGLSLVLLPMLLLPIVGGALAFSLVHLFSVLTVAERLRMGHLRALQVIAASIIATGHGVNNVRMPAAIVLVAAGAVGVHSTGGTVGILPGALAAVILALGLGTLAGGRRIIRTLARRITDLSTPQGLAAQASAAIVLAVASVAGLPTSSTHTVTSGIAGSALAVGARTVRWPVIGRIVLAWAATPIAAALLAMLLQAGIGRAL